MPVPKIAAAQFATQIAGAISDINSGHDVDIGPIPDTIINPAAQVFEDQNDRIRTVSQLILLDELTKHDDTDVDNFVKNESIYRNNGGKSSTTVVFSRATAPTFDLTVQRGFPIATIPDEATGQSIVFVTTESKTLQAVSASTYFNIQTQRYELEVSAQAVVAGQIGQVGPNRIKQPLRPLTGFDSVTNRVASSPVVDRESNDQLIQRYKLSIVGTQLATRAGLSLYVLAKMPDAGDVLVAYADDPIVTRSGDGGNAVDVIVTGIQTVAHTENAPFVGLNQPIILTNQPITELIDVPGFVEGTDYEFVRDTSGDGGSVRAQDAIKFIPGGSAPVAGTTFAVSYYQNALVSNLQSLFSDPDIEVGGQDVLVRTGNQVDITITANLVVSAGFNPTAVGQAVVATILDFINKFKLGQSVEKSDVDAKVRAITGVDNFIFTTFDRVGDTGNTDINVAKNEFARIAEPDIVLT